MRSFTLTTLLLPVSSVTFAQNLSASYAPVYVRCPTDAQFNRPAVQGLHPTEVQWVAGRRRNVAYALADYLDRANISDFDIGAYTDALYRSNYSAVPIIAYGISGGGSASAYTGTGGLRALDNRFDAANDAGTGGLLQCLTYFTGQSGGAWPVVSFTTSEFPTADDILNLWQPQINRSDATMNGTYAATFASMFLDVVEKAEAGFNVTVADFLGRSTSYEFIDGPRGGLGVTFSSVVNQTKFKGHDMPFPILQVSQVLPSDQMADDIKEPNANATIYDLTPLEFGSWEGSAQAFTSMEYLGTRYSNGQPLNSSRCVRGFDQASFILGTIQDAFNFWYLGDESDGVIGNFPKRGAPTLSSRDVTDLFPNATIQGLIELYNESFGLNVSQIAYSLVPNPFLSSTTSPVSSLEDLSLVDATDVGSALPFSGLLHRNASLIIMWDDNADAYPYGWLNGTNMYGAYQRFNSASTFLPFPKVPTPATFLSRNYTTRPVFFGCNTSLTTTGDSRSPIVAYFANSPYSSYTNYSFTVANLSIARVEDIWLNSFNQVTQGNNTLDPNWSACLACAAIDRSLEVVGMKRPQVCEACFEEYCWDGTEDDNVMGGYGMRSLNGQEVLDPSLYLNMSDSYQTWDSTVGLGEGVTLNGTK